MLTWRTIQYTVSNQSNAAGIRLISGRSAFRMDAEDDRVTAMTMNMPFIISLQRKNRSARHISWQRSRTDRETQSTPSMRSVAVIEVQGSELNELAQKSRQLDIKASGQKQHSFQHEIPNVWSENSVAFSRSILPLSFQWSASGSVTYLLTATCLQALRHMTLHATRSSNQRGTRRTAEF